MAAATWQRPWHLLLVLALTIAACGSDEPGSQPADSSTTPPAVPESLGDVKASGQATTTQLEVPPTPGELAIPECNDEAMCPLAFVLNGVFYSVGCTAIRDSAVTEDVIGSGDFHGEAVTVNRIAGVDDEVMVALSIPGGDCSDIDPDERRTPWSMAFGDYDDLAAISAVVCDVGELSAAQRLADGCHLGGELLTCGAGPAFPPDVLDDLTVYPEPSEYFGPDIAAIIDTGEAEDLSGWHVIVEEQHVQLLLRRNPDSGQLEYLVDSGHDLFDAPRPCEPKSVD